MHLLLLALLLPACVAYLTTKPNLGSAYSTVAKSKLCVGQTESSSLTYLVDTTGSMYDDFLQLKLVNSWLLDRVTARFPCGVRQYTMVEFNDPTVGPVKVTNSKTEFGHFFNSLVASGGEDCPELALEGLELALNNSPSNTFILVLTDASAKDYNDIALLNNIRSLINTTKSQVFFLITGLCMGLSDPQFLVYRDIALQSFGHVFQVDLFDLGKVFHYLDFTLSRPANTSTRLFSGEYTVGNHSDSFPVADNFTALLVTTDGVIYSLKIVGPHSIDLELKKIVSEIWGSMYLLKNPIKGIWTMYIYAGGPHSVRVEGFTAINISSTANCSECDPNATCKEEMGFLECSCKDGFIGDGFTCTDIDECTYAWSNNCSFNCINTFGSYECLCPSGYSQISGNTCVDIDECSISELNNCHPLASCQNYEGSYLCYCPSGYFGDGIYCEVDECSKDVCGFGVDCIKSNGSFKCSDPCSNYTILNDPWRSSANIYVSLWNCDHYINGWYRFIGSGGVRMPEYCVPTFSCDTAAPMWLSGSHPLLTDGIVNRTACAHWSDSCCLWSTTVQIKACPEGYHVYKLSGTPTCSLSYCTDPASANDSLTCAADEEWKVIDGEYGCHCKNKYKISGVEDLRPELVCEAHRMRAKFHKCQLKSLKLDIRNIRFRGSECFGFQNDNITNEFSVLSPLQDGICGVRLRKNATHAIYVNTLDFSLDYEDTVIREEQLSITLSCAYPLNMMVSLETAVRPIMSSTNISVDGTGQFTAHIALYQDSSYLSPYEGSEVVLSSKSTLYIGVIVDGVDSSEYAVVMKNCYATPTQNANDSIKYYIIKNSCPNRQDKTIKVMENGVSDKGRLSVQIFKFIGDYNLIFLHCEIKLCDPSASACTPTCSGSRAASDSNEQSFVLNVGPVVRGDVSLSSASGTHYPWTLFAFPLLFLTTILFNI